MADEPEVTPEVPTETPVTETAQPDETAEVTADLPPTDEPEGGKEKLDTRTPDQIRGAKEYAERRRLERELESERIERVRVEERLRALEEYRPAAPAAPAEREYTAEEVQTAIDAGKVTVAQAAEYFAEVKAKRLQAQAVQVAAAAEPFKRAVTEVNEYMAHLPWTKDQTSPEFKQVKAEYQSLVRDFGYADDIRTQLVAIRQVAGSLDKVKQRQQVATQTRTARAATAHSETPAGGNVPRKTDDIANAPELMKRVWDRTGATPAQRAKEWAYHLQPARKAGRAG